MRLALTSNCLTLTSNCSIINQPLQSLHSVAQKGVEDFLRVFVWGWKSNPLSFRRAPFQPNDFKLMTPIQRKMSDFIKEFYVGFQLLFCGRSEITGEFLNLSHIS